MALFRSMTRKSLVLVPMARSARQSVGRYPVLLNYSMTPSSRTMTQELATSSLAEKGGGAGCVSDFSHAMNMCIIPTRLMNSLCFSSCMLLKPILMVALHVSMWTRLTSIPTLSMVVQSSNNRRMCTCWRTMMWPLHFKCPPPPSPTHTHTHVRVNTCVRNRGII